METEVYFRVTDCLFCENIIKLLLNTCKSTFCIRVMKSAENGTKSVRTGE